MARLAIPLVLFVVASFTEFSLASYECNHDCVLSRLADLEEKQRDSDAENQKLREIISEQQSIIDAQARRIDILENTVANLQSNPDSQEHENKDNTTIVSAYKHAKSRQSVNKQIRGIEEARGKRQISPERSGFAFSAYLDHNVELAKDQTIEFNQVIINEGNCYRTYTGIFTVPETGVYLLTFSVGGRYSRGLRVFLVKNGLNLVDANADSFHNYQELQGGNTVIIRLQINDQVWLKAGEAHDNIEGDASVRLSTFSGVFLYG